MTARRLAAEFLGTAGLLLAIVGSGITASTDGAASAQLLQHAIVVGAALAVLILTFGPVSGAHFNPVVTVLDTMFGGMRWRTAAGYIISQTAGAISGVIATNLLFGRPTVEIAGTDRTGMAAAASEAVATFGLLVVIFGVVRSGRTNAVPAAVGVWIAGAIYFTPSASFANPAVTVARTLSDTYTGIAPSGIPGFVAAQVLGAGLAAMVIGWLFRAGPETARAVVLPHPNSASVDRERPHVVARTQGVNVTDNPTVMFLCVHNAGRSQMAAGWLEHLSGGRVDVLSGGSAPADEINAVAVEAMREVGVDISRQSPKPWSEATLGAADVIVTMGCGDTCPVYLGKRYLDWELDDPAGKDLEAVRGIRDEIEQRVRGLLEELSVAAAR